jgi:hypothetical protein
MRRLVHIVSLIALILAASATAGAGFNDEVAAIMCFGNDLIVGGRFDQVGPLSAYRVVRWDGATWTPMGGPPWSRTETLAEYGEVYASGHFGSAIE